MQLTRFVMVGGFLGAGKTTALGRLARHYQARGHRIGVVTNDQAQDLVDTSNLRHQGFAVEEVAGACFCCRFDELIDKTERLSARERPDVILAEPVGSCTDLVATVIQPLRDLYENRFRVAPYSVLFKPSHGLRILRNQEGGFSPKAAYIFRKQLEEADAIVLNRIDELAPNEIDDLAGLVRSCYPATPVLKLSARTGLGFECLTEMLEQEGMFGQKILDIDYDTYAEGEAELGWLNCSARVHAARPFLLDRLLINAAQALRDRLANERAEIAHLKIIGMGDVVFGAANLVSTHSEPELSMQSNARVNEAEVIINARVAIDPRLLDTYVRAAIEATCAQDGIVLEFGKIQAFRPGRPQPTHRYSTVK
jgi:Ni2+-binding GTPase involved in maturation of urease and hydrogenase